MAKFKFKVNLKNISLEEQTRKEEEKQAEIRWKNLSDKYQDICTYEIPLCAPSQKTQSKLVISAIRNGNDDENDDVNEVYLNVRTFIKKEEDEDFIPKKGTYVPMRYANQIASTIFEILEELDAKNIKDPEGNKYLNNSF